MLTPMCSVKCKSTFLNLRVYVVENRLEIVFEAASFIGRISTLASHVKSLIANYYINLYRKKLMKM